jgi:hypothetical protein
MYNFLYKPSCFDVFIVKDKWKYNIYLKKNKLIFIFFSLYFNNYLNFFLFFKKKKWIWDLNLYFFSWAVYIVKKIKFKHKISWVYIYRKNLQIFKISTNLSHFIIFFINNLKFKRRKKHLFMHTIIIWGVDLIFLNFILCNILKLSFFNKYTQRGFKLARGKIQKRLGKVSKYTVLKSKVF